VLEHVCVQSWSRFCMTRVSVEPWVLHFLMTRMRRLLLARL
jgi:hypothetical protein